MSPTDDSLARGLFRTRRLLVLDFDGPVTRLLPDPAHIGLADRVKRLLSRHGALLPPAVAGCIDHVQVLRYAAAECPDLVPAVEALCSEEELAAAATATPAPGAVEVLDRARRQRRSLAIVTNNDPRVVARFARRQGMDLTGVSVHGRERGHPERLKPDPWMLRAALHVHRTQPLDAVFVGDSVSDVVAAAAAGMPCVGVASDAASAEALRSAGAVGIVADLGAFR